MESITSKRHFLNYYGLLLLSILFIGIGIIMILTDHPKDRAMLTFGGLVFISSSLYLFITVVKKTPKITIDKNYITFNNQSFRIDDVNQMALIARYSFTVTGRLEGAKITFKDGTIKYIFDRMYSNTSQMKVALDYLVNNHKNKVAKKIKTDLTSEHLNIYKGVFMYSFNGIMYLSFTIFLVYVLFCGKQENPEGKYLIMSLFLFITLVFQWQFNYFELNNNYFRVRNQMKLWKNDIYKIGDIKEVTFQSQGRAPHCLKIIFKDYTAKKYTAATLSGRKWKELQRALEKLNIKVINKL